MPISAPGIVIFFSALGAVGTYADNHWLKLIAAGAIVAAVLFGRTD